MTHRDFVISKMRPKELANKYIEEDRVERAAIELHTKYGEVGATWAACVQAVKTDYVPQFHLKYAEKMKENAAKTKSMDDKNKKKNKKTKKETIASDATEQKAV